MQFVELKRMIFLASTVIELKIFVLVCMQVPAEAAAQDEVILFVIKDFRGKFYSELQEHKFEVIPVKVVII